MRKLLLLTNQGIRIIDAMAVIFKDERLRSGIKMKPE